MKCILSAELLPASDLVSGRFFRPTSHEAKYYLICFDALEPASRAKVRVSEIMGVPSDSLSSGDLVQAYTGDLETVILLDIFAKYYFPSFPAEAYQWYHDHNGKCDEIKALGEVMAYALQEGIREAGIRQL